MNTGITDIIDILLNLLPLLIPLFLIQTGLWLAALIHIIKSKTFKKGSKILWIIVVTLLDIIGPVLYFTIGRGESESDE